MHAGVSAGSVAVLAMTHGPWVLLAWPVVAVVGWSRVVLRDHTLAQVLAGSASGAVVAAATSRRRPAGRCRPVPVTRPT
ncbi:phosphatase PAP2 family protein [Streptomyces yangpuensis]|uniref:phosphatase PAP2 family protein n=1 Tax=Streptomyces yangpuensis TaxID=1648182 RepID=UPI0036587C95